ncbi:MAG: hypothetical protein RLZZ224_1350 [Verrucomicrobiota bacterium]|jgi:uncharacterized membrane protein YidH (DUF202 family)
MQKTDQREIVFDEVNLLLSEKRTALSLLRTGIAIFTIPLSIGSILIATSQLYRPQDILFLLVPVLAGCSLLVLISFWLLVSSYMKLRHNEKRLTSLLQKNQFLRQLVEP